MAVRRSGVTTRSGLAGRALLAAGVLALSAAACASQGTTGPAGRAVAAGATTSGLTLGDSGPGSAPNTGTPSASQTSTSDSQSSPSDAASASSSAAPSSSDSPTSEFHGPTPDHKVTDTVTEGGYKLKIHSVTLPYTAPAGAGFKAPPTKAYLLLDFEATNVSDQPLMFSTLGAFDLRDSGNISYLVSVSATDDLPEDKQFQDRVMKPGETSSGALVFMLDEHAKGLTLTFKGNVWHADQDRPVIDLGH